MSTVPETKLETATAPMEPASTAPAPDTAPVTSEISPEATEHAQPTVSSTSPDTAPDAPPRPRELVVDERLAGLRAMFPDFDDAVLNSVLESVNGDSERAVTALLSMSDPDYVPEQQPEAPAPLPPQTQAQTQEDLDEQFARALMIEDERQAAATWQARQGPRPTQPQSYNAYPTGQGKDSMQEIQEQLNKFAESGKRTIGTLFSKVKAKIQEFDQPASGAIASSSAQQPQQDYGYNYGVHQPGPAAGRHAQQAYFQQQQQTQAEIPAYYDPNSAATTSPPASATARGYDAGSPPVAISSTVTPTPPTTHSGTPPIDGGKLGMLPKRPVSLLQTTVPPSSGAPPSSDDELEYAENPFEDGPKK